MAKGSAYRFCLLQNALGVRAMGGLHTYMYIYIYICMYRRTFVFETFLFPFVTFQVSRDFDLKFEKWEKGDFVERLLGVFVLF